MLARALAAGAQGRLVVVLSILAAAWGAGAAWRQAWVCDDAFISFRYADNLVHGLGLVYNAGERVEGYSNLLWTLWAALGMRLGARPETWSVAWGAACYAATILLLGVRAAGRPLRSGAPALALPLAAMLAATHRDWNLFATSGLETSSFTFLTLLGYDRLTTAPSTPRRAAIAGFVLALVSLTRPDGMLFAVLGGAFVLGAMTPRWRCLGAYAGVLLAITIAAESWRVAYYGDPLPNTYYAKSAQLAWYSQGWIYVRLYFQKYWVALAGVPLAAIAAMAARRSASAREALGAASWDREVALAALFALGYTFYVLRLGGDFMYARLLIPVTPFYFILLERGLMQLAPRRVLVQWGVAAAALAAMILTPQPLGIDQWVSGIVDERQFYTPEATAKTRAEGAVLRRFFEGLPVRVAYVGSQAGLMYYSHPEVAIESGTGLTDRFIARQPLAKRGRIGHEKVASLDYLVERRRAHLALHYFAGKTLGVDDYLPTAVIGLGGVYARALTWDPALMSELRRRGASVPDFLLGLDQYMATMGGRPDAQVRSDYEKLRHFYFEHVEDPARERAFRTRLGLGP